MGNLTELEQILITILVLILVFQGALNTYVFFFKDRKVKCKCGKGTHTYGELELNQCVECGKPIN